MSHEPSRQFGDDGHRQTAANQSRTLHWSTVYWSNDGGCGIKGNFFLQGSNLPLHNYT